MKPSTDRREAVDVLAAMLRGGAPDAIDDRRRDAQIARAIDAAGARALVRSEPRKVGWVLAAAAAVVLGVVALRPGELPPPSALTLSTGDRVHVMAGAVVRFEHVDDHARRIALTSGAAVFDVAAIAGGRFEVATPELEVVVRGTVFGVERVGERTRVRVYEGSVEVRERGVVTRLASGDAYVSGEGRVTDPGDPLVDVGHQIAARREARAQARPPVTHEIVLAPTLPIPRQPTSLAVPPPTETEAPATTVVAAQPAPRAGSRRSSARAELEAWLTAGRFEEARAAAHDARTRAAGPDAWRYGSVEARALQGLGRIGEAAALYDALVVEAPAVERPALAFRAAAARLDRLGDARGALASLDGASFEGTPLEERALGLRARALDRAGDHDGAAQAARSYLARFPAGGLADLVRPLAQR